MNERIQELHREAEKWVADNFSTDELDPYEWWEKEEQKFAELIVKECIQTLRDNTPVIDEHDSVEDWDRGYIRAMTDCEHHIQEHFGVGL